VAAHRLEITSGSDYIAEESDDPSSAAFSPSMAKHHKLSSAKGTPSERMHRLNTKIKSKKFGDPKDGGDGGSGSARNSPARPGISSKEAGVSASAAYDAEKLKEKRTARTMYPPLLSPPTDSLPSPPQGNPRED
jgi:hypothetical protein